jgi:Lrp/AsnC family transcriptional regulator, leucine-responsive regulatory protein
MSEVVACYLLTVNCDYLLHVRVSDVEAFRDFMRTRLTAMEGVVETPSSIVLQELKAATSITLATLR